MIRSIAYGKNEDGKFYIQTCCNEEHTGQECDCKTLDEGLMEKKAKKLAKVKSSELNVPVERW